MWRIVISWFAVICLVVVSGCGDAGLSLNSSTTDSSSGNSTSTNSTSPNPVSTTAVKPTSSASPTPDSPLAKLARLSGTATVEMKLKSGVVTIEVDGTNAPITAGNFVDLVKRGTYTNLIFHRVVREPNPFVAQGGDPLGNGTGGFVDPATGTERRIPLEILPEDAKSPIYSKTLESTGITKPPKLKHSRGAVAMARSQSPDSASSQFYITLADVNFLDGSYAVFGYVTSGMEFVDKIQVGDRIESITVTKGLENLKNSG
jgi:peptidyl-prolyl cis-trans isomerase B (cyclophilin B)